MILQIERIRDKKDDTVLFKLEIQKKKMVNEIHLDNKKNNLFVHNK